MSNDTLNYKTLILYLVLILLNILILGQKNIYQFRLLTFKFYIFYISLLNFLNFLMFTTLN